MKRLLVSDLDGTLLNRSKELTPRTIQVVNEFIDGGGLFTIATARMAYGADTKLADLRLSLPGIIMNGAALYRFDTGEYTGAVHMGEEVALRTLETARRAGVGGFVYSIGADGIRIGYLREEDLQFEQYNSLRAQESALELRQVPQVEKWVSENPVSYIAVTGDQAALLELESTLLDDAALRVTGYENIYTQTRCLELADHRAGKEAPARTLVSELGIEELVVFGDNHNDLELMRLADVSFAPADSAPEALSQASEIIGKSYEDAVAELMAKRFL